MGIVIDLESFGQKNGLDDALLSVKTAIAELESTWKMTCKNLKVGPNFFSSRTERESESSFGWLCLYFKCCHHGRHLSGYFNVEK